MTTRAPRCLLSRSFPLPPLTAARIDRFEAEMAYADTTARSLVLGPAPAAGDLNLRSNDYLSLGRHPELVDAQVRALVESGNGELMSAVFLNPGNPQFDLERKFADLLHAEGAVLFQSGYQANTGLLEAVACPGLPVYIDQMAHASLYQGVTIAGADLRPFRHSDVEHLIRQLRRYGPGIILMETVYSTDGSLGPIADIMDAAEDFGCMLIADESHSLGTHGPGGAGLVVALGLQDRVHFRTASLAKAFCGRAGLVACPRRFAPYLRFTSAPSIFSSAVMPHELVGFARTIDIVQRDEYRRVRLHHNADRLRSNLDALGYNVAASASQIIALEAGSEQSVVRLGQALNARGVYGSPFFAPATAKHRACIRLSVNAMLGDDELERITAVCGEIRAAVGLAEWASTRRKLRRRTPLQREPAGAGAGEQLPAAPALRDEAGGETTLRRAA